MTEELNLQSVSDGQAGFEETQTQHSDQTVEGADSTVEVDGAASEAAEEKLLPENVQKVINRKHWQAKEAERKLEAANKRLAELESKLNTNQEPQIPEMPDTYDPEYAAKVMDRDKKVAEHAQWKANQDFQVKQQQTQAEEARRKQQEQLQQQITVYDQRVVQSGISPEESIQQQNIVAPVLGADLSYFVLNHAEGPAIVKYLSQDVMALDKIANMHPMDAASYIGTEVVKKAVKVKKSATTQTPDPPETLGKGAGGGTKSQSKYMKGVVLE